MENKFLSPQQKEEILKTLKLRFEKNMNRHKEVVWENVEAKLLKNDDKLLSILKMEESGGEPDVVSFENTSEIIICDCSAESPKGRRSLCYDQKALDSRKEYKPKDSAVNMAENMGIKLLTKEEYAHLQTLGDFDTKTSSWLLTPYKIRDLGGAIFGDKRYKSVFVYHNGVESYYASRGFRGLIKV